MPLDIPSYGVAAPQVFTERLKEEMNKAEGGKGGG